MRMKVICRRKQKLDRTFALIESHDIKPGTVFVPEGMEELILRDLRRLEKKKNRGGRQTG